MPEQIRHVHVVGEDGNTCKVCGYVPRVYEVTGEDPRNVASDARQKTEATADMNTYTRAVVRPRIAVDLDGVLYDFHGTARFLVNHYFPEANIPPVEEIWSEWMPESLKAHWGWVWAEGVEKGLFRHGNLYKGSIEALRDMSEFADLVVVTHRPHATGIMVSAKARRTATIDTIAWLAYQNLPICEFRMLMQAEPKSTVPAEVYLDDGAHVVNEVALSRPEALTILWDRVWNRDVPVERRVVRVKSWAEVLVAIKARLRERV